MAILQIRTVPDPILRKKARPIRTVDEAIRKLARDMIETMQEAGGVGLAANQVGILKRLIVLQMPEEDPQIWVNPEITRREGEREIEEGCLSVPGYVGLITRSVRVKARALDQHGSKFRVTAEELLAQAIEHEVDHLNGILYMDHLEAHEKLRKLGEETDEPHMHDVDYEVHADHADGDDDGQVEVLTARASLSQVRSESLRSDLAYDLSSGARRTRVHSDDPAINGGVLLDKDGRSSNSDEGEREPHGH